MYIVYNTIEKILLWLYAGKTVNVTCGIEVHPILPYKSILRIFSCKRWVVKTAYIYIHLSVHNNTMYKYIVQ